jgi:hypothetical protein
MSVLATAQSLSNARSKWFLLTADSLVLDTLSLIPQSVSIKHNGNIVSDSLFSINNADAKIKWNKNFLQNNFGDSVLVFYRVFPVLFTKPVAKRSKEIIQQYYSGQYNPSLYKDGTDKNEDLFKLEGITKNGSISRGISFGNNQDVVVNSSLNLQLAGKIGDDVELLAAVTDNNVPLQPEGNTQQIQDFDKVFVQLSKGKSKLIAGDFEVGKPESYFMNFFKKGQGVLFATGFDLNKNADTIKTLKMNMRGAAAISKGKFARNTFNGIESNQGPYRLTGAENELFIIVLSGSERVFIDGQLLTRGQDRDYVIDYNTSQIIFTPRRLITKDSRIVVEFQYSDKNYVRTMLHYNNEVSKNKLKLKFNVFSEQDSKNQPLFQELDDDKRKLIANVGDSISNAFVSGGDSVAFSRSEILYAKDTITINNILYNIFIYSTDSTKAFYRLSFSYVGLYNGNYIPQNSAANGKVYSFVAPVNGVPQGSYEPVILLVTPKKQQLFTMGADYVINPSTKLFSEVALSNYDVNLFSEFDKANDKGIAINAGAINETKLSAKDSALKLISQINIEHVNKKFKPIENYRPIEFVRDWNLPSSQIVEDENIVSARTGLVKSRTKNFSYGIKSFLKGEFYKGFLQSVSGNYEYKKFNLAYTGSYLNTTGTFSKSNYVRSFGDFSKSFNKIVAGYKQENERNKIYNPVTDTLLYNSFGYDAGSFYVKSNDSLKINFKTEISRRYDFNVVKNDFALASTGDIASADISFEPIEGSLIELGSTYRNLQTNNALLNKPNDETLLNRATINFNLLKGGITTNTYYEAGTGQEPKQAYSFIKVAKGSGVFEWIDYNSNGIEELNEFETASFTDRAEYIKIFTPTNEFIKTQFNSLSQVVGFNPQAFVKPTTTFKKIITKFSNQFATRFDNKMTNKSLEQGLNPFQINTNDTSLITTNSSLRNTVFVNRSSSVASGEFTFNTLRNKLLLANGFETREQNSYTAIIRGNVKRIYGASVTAELGENITGSPYFNRNYHINFTSLEPRLSIQPGVVFRTTLYYKLQLKENTMSDIGEKTEIYSMGVECKYSSFKNGSAEAKLTFSKINYNAIENTPLAFEMLEGLKTGNNILWNFSLNRNLTQTLQISLLYEGRKSENIKTIHTANMQVRAVF